jgi:transposase
MLGPAKPRRLDQPIAVSLDALVPQDNFYRHLEATLDLGFVRDWAQDLYAERGRPSIDPIVSERQLIAIAALNLAHRWYLGYALDETLPNHSSLTRIRQRLGVDVFHRFFERVVDRCQETGLVWGKELYFDGTKVEAHASPTRRNATSATSSRMRKRQMTLARRRCPICPPGSFACWPSRTPTHQR